MKSRVFLAILALTTFAGNAPASSVCRSEGDAYADAASWADEMCSWLGDPDLGSLYGPCSDALEQLANARMVYLRCLYRLDQNGAL